MGDEVAGDSVDESAIAFATVHQAPVDLHVGEPRIRSEVQHHVGLDERRWSTSGQHGPARHLDREGLALPLRHENLIDHGALDIIKPGRVGSRGEITGIDQTVRQAKCPSDSVEVSRTGFIAADDRQSLAGPIE